MEDLVIGLGLGAVIGLSLGLMGAGGSVLAIPALVYGAGLSAHEAAGTSLMVVGATALFGSSTHYRAGRTKVTTGLALGGLGLPGALAGAWLNQRADEEVILLALAGVMAIAAVSMIVGGLARASAPDGGQADRPPAWGAKIAAAGVGLGVLTGFLGVGGGFLVVPLLVLVLRFPMRMAVGTSLLVIAINSTAGLAAHVGLGEVNVGVALPFLAGALIASWIASALSVRLGGLRYQHAFAVLLIAIAVSILYDNLGSLG